MIIDKIRTLYKGDSLAGGLYVMLGMIALGIGWHLFVRVYSLGFYYLGVGMMIFSAYMIGKGIVMLYMYYSRYRYYNGIKSVNNDTLEDEWNYVEYRKKKKNRNRRWYIYILIITVAVSIYGFFDRERGLILSTCIPILLMTIIELTMGLMTQFRLHEMTQILHKELHKDKL